MKTPITGRCVLVHHDDAVEVMTLYLGAKPQDELQKWSQERQAQIKEVVSVPVDIPMPDRYFRKAWRFNDGVLVVDLPTARELQVAFVREKRDQALKALDGPELRAISTGDNADLASIRAEKQRLRDIPAVVRRLAGQCSAVDDLKTVGIDLVEVK